jgi:hypothetical protein
MDILKKRYFQLYTKDLGSLLGSELRGTLETLAYNVIQAAEEEYDPAVHTDEKAEKDVKVLHQMGQGRLGTNEAGIFKILVASPQEYLKKLNTLYAEKYGYALWKALEMELRGDAEKAAVFLMGMKLKPYEEIAKLIEKACKGFGTNEDLLSATLIRYQEVMNEVSLAHVELFGQTIHDRIRSETRGDYEKLLLLLAGRVNA